MKILVTVQKNPPLRGARVQLFESARLWQNWSAEALRAINQSLKENGAWCRVDGKLTLKAEQIDTTDIWYVVP